MPAAPTRADWERLAGILRARRARDGWSQDDAADHCGVASYTYRKLEGAAVAKDIQRTFRRDVLAKVGNALGYGPDGIDRILAGEDPDTIAKEVAAREANESARRLAHAVARGRDILELSADQLAAMAGDGITADDIRQLETAGMTVSGSVRNEHVVRRVSRALGLGLDGLHRIAAGESRKDVERDVAAERSDVDMIALVREILTNVGAHGGLLEHLTEQLDRNTARLADLEREREALCGDGSDGPG